MNLSPARSLNHHLANFAVDPQPCVATSVASFSSTQSVFSVVPPTASHQLHVERKARNSNPCANCKTSHVRCITAPPYSTEQCKFCYEHDFSKCPSHESNTSRCAGKVGEIQKYLSENAAAGFDPFPPVSSEAFISMTTPTMVQNMEQITDTSPFDARDCGGQGPSEHEYVAGMGRSSAPQDARIQCVPMCPVLLDGGIYFGGSSNIFDRHGNVYD